MMILNWCSWLDCSRRENGGDNTHFGVFDPIGLDSTLAYLDCFESSQ